MNAENTNLSYSKKKANSLIAARSLKNSKLPEGTVLTVAQIVADEKEPRMHYLLCDTKENKVRVPMKDFVNMKNVDGGASYHAGEGDDSDEIIIPASFTITGSTDRKAADGTVVFPLGAYNKGDDFIKTLRDDSVKNMEWDTLVEGGLKANNGGYEPVQDYVISIED